jgi:hypothetical protein
MARIEDFGQGFSLEEGKGRVWKTRTRMDFGPSGSLCAASFKVTAL